MYYSGHVCAGESLWVPREMEVEGVVSLRMVVGAGVLDWGPYVLMIGHRSRSSGLYSVIGLARGDGTVLKSATGHCLAGLADPWLSQNSEP